MYYYIAEPLTIKAEHRQVEAVKSLLSQLGIAGEFAIASPARTVEEHLELAFSKGFTTIVGIGSDALVNRVAATMLLRQYDKAVLGAIPLQPGQLLWSMIGARSLGEIGDILCSRHLVSIDALALGRGQMIITPAELRVSRPVRFQLRYRQVDLQGLLTDVRLETSGEVKLWDATYGQPTGFFSRWFSRPTTEKALSMTHFKHDRWALATATPLPITVNGQTVAQTPLQAIRQPKALKLIVSRDKIAPEKGTES